MNTSSVEAALVELGGALSRSAHSIGRGHHGTCDMIVAMVTPEITPLYHDLDFNGPLSDARAERLIRCLGPLDGARVVDIGCGWGELLLRLVEAAPTATGIGVDQSMRDIAHARSLAEARGLADRVTFESADVANWATPHHVDVVLNVGASHVWGGDPVIHTANALTAMRGMLEPGGLALFGECFWETTPTQNQLEIMEDIPRDQYGTFAELVDVALSHGFEPVDVGQATLDEWDVFESGHGRTYTTWLTTNPQAPDAAKVREMAASHRRRWQRGWRGVTGFAYLSLVAV